MLYSEELEFLMEAHNGISSRVAEEAGFNGIWGSGLALSAQFGVRDNNEASWTQIVDMVEFMSDVTSIPILLDGDTGYGNFNNMRRLVRKLEQRGVAGVCIEDKLFPKTNSFIEGRQDLASIEEFSGKNANIENLERAYKDPDVVRPNLDKINEAIGWEPTTKIQEGIEKTVSWYKENEDYLKDLVYVNE